jgi:hypothetical protein
MNSNESNNFTNKFAIFTQRLKQNSFREFRNVVKHTKTVFIKVLLELLWDFVFVSSMLFPSMQNWKWKPKI